MKILIFLLAIMGCLVLVIMYSALVVASDEDDKEEEDYEAKEVMKDERDSKMQ